MILKRKKKLLKKTQKFLIISFIFLQSKHKKIDPPNATLICSLVMVVEFRCENDVSCVMDLLGQKAELSGSCETRLKYLGSATTYNGAGRGQICSLSQFSPLRRPHWNSDMLAKELEKANSLEIPQDEAEIGWCV